MNVETKIHQLKRGLEYAATEFAKDLALFQELQGELEKLPGTEETLGDMTGYHYKAVPFVRVNYYPDTGEKAEEIRSAVQVVLKVPATREFVPSDGTMTYVFTTPRINVYITKGRPSPACVIEPVTVTKTEYKIVCPEPETAEA